MGLLDELRLRVGAMPFPHRRAEYLNGNDPEAFYGIGAPDEPGEIPLPIVAMTVKATVANDERAGVRIDVACPAPSIPDADTLALTNLQPPTPSGTATIDGDKVRYIPDPGFVGTATSARGSEGRVLTGKPSLVRLQVSVTSGFVGCSHRDRRPSGSR